MNARIKRILIDPLAAHYDKIIAVVALGCLIASVIILGARMAMEKKKQALFDRKIGGYDELQRKPADVAAVSREPVEKGRRELKNPFRLHPGGSNTTFIVPEKRVSCQSCRKPFPYDAKQCPFCSHVEGAPPKPPKSDNDIDKMPDDWESKYGLNPGDASDANIDMDGDGFTNLEEFLAGEQLGRESSPIDPNIVPPAWMFNKLVAIDAKALEFKLIFMSSMSSTGGKMIFAINHVETKQTYWKRIGEQVLNFTVMKYEEKWDTRTNQQGIVSAQQVDVSELTLQSADGLSIVLEKGKPKPQWEKSADLYYVPKKQTITVKEGGEFDIGSWKYRVKEIDVASRKVLISDLTLGGDKLIESATFKREETASPPPVKDAPISTAPAAVPVREGKPGPDPFER